MDNKYLAPMVIIVLAFIAEASCFYFLSIGNDRLVFAANIVFILLLVWSAVCYIQISNR